MTRSTKSYPTDGFTLLELMVAMTLMSLVVAVAFSGISIGVESWRRGSNTVEKMDQRSTIERLLKRQLALAFPLKFEKEGNTYVLFRGSEDRLEFVSDYSLLNGPGDYQRIEYTISEGLLLYRETRLAIPEGAQPAPKTLGRFSRLSFRFLGPEKGPEKDARVWFTEWSQDMGIPFAVQIRIDNDTFSIPMVNRS